MIFSAIRTPRVQEIEVAADLLLPPDALPALLATTVLCRKNTLRVRPVIFATFHQGKVEGLYQLYKLSIELPLQPLETLGRKQSK